MHQIQPAVIAVIGMHRSGTSLLASLLHRSGCRMGETLLPGDLNNQPGYFEDLEFLNLNRRMLAATMPADVPGHADWGWTEGMNNSGVDAGRLVNFVAEAEALINRRASRVLSTQINDEPVTGCWGWKDPRTAILLDFWNARLPNAYYVFVYRAPWEVAESMQRLGAEVFLDNPDYAYAVWLYYNRLLLRFAQAHRNRTLIISAAAMARDPQKVLELVRFRFKLTLALDGTNDLADARLLKRSGKRLATLAAAVHPECLKLLEELEASADLPAHDDPPPLLSAPLTVGNPEVAIIIPCFNHGEFLLEAIASVEQSVSVPYELIIVNDGSSEPQTLAVLACLRRAGYRVIDQENRGLAEARNRGISEVSCPFFLPLDADNRLRPFFIESAVKILAANPAVAAVYGDRSEFGLRSGRVVVGVPDLNRLLCGNYIDACAVIRVEVWHKCAGYDPRIPFQVSEDWEFWLSLLELGFTLNRLDMETFDYRVRPHSLVSKTKNPEVQTAVERYVLAKHAPLYLAHLRRQVDRLEARP